MPTFGSTSAAITLSFDFDIIYSSEHIINNSFFSFQYGCVNVCKLMEIWIAAYLSHSGCMREWCCPGHVALPTPVCPTGMFWCPHSVRCNPQRTLEQLCASPGWDKTVFTWSTNGWNSLCSDMLQNGQLERAAVRSGTLGFHRSVTLKIGLLRCAFPKKTNSILAHEAHWNTGIWIVAESVLQSHTQHVESVESLRFLWWEVMERSQRWARDNANRG